MLAGIVRDHYSFLFYRKNKCTRGLTSSAFYFFLIIRFY
nr:MAG TPA: hypothetical protein [Caudoviricetes sp.]